MDKYVAIAFFRVSENKSFAGFELLDSTSRRGKDSLLILTYP